MGASSFSVTGMIAGWVLSLSRYPKVMPLSNSTCSNKEPILAVLKEYLAGGSGSGSGAAASGTAASGTGGSQQTAGLFLEVASGTGQHCAFFAAALPHLQFQPTEYAAEDMGRCAGGQFTVKRVCGPGVYC